jgi:hypothetical protein
MDVFQAVEQIQTLWDGIHAYHVNATQEAGIDFILASFTHRGSNPTTISFAIYNTYRCPRYVIIVRYTAKQATASSMNPGESKLYARHESTDILSALRGLIQTGRVPQVFMRT